VRFARIAGPALAVECRACHQNMLAGSEPYTSAATGRLTTPGEAYQDLESPGAAYYCAGCARKLAEPDPTRSRTRFYQDTAGQVVDYSREAPPEESAQRPALSYGRKLSWYEWASTKVLRNLLWY